MPELPIIGTVAYDAGCHVTQVWEDGSAYAYCPEDGATYYHDPDGQALMDHGILFRDLRSQGWHAVK